MGAMQLMLVLAIGFVGLVASQDTYKCPDGWMLEEDRTGCRCFLIGPDEAVTRSTADLICAGHSGSWVAELDHPGINYWLKSRLLEAIPVVREQNSGLAAVLRGATASTSLALGPGTT